MHVPLNCQLRLSDKLARLILFFKRKTLWIFDEALYVMLYSLFNSTNYFYSIGANQWILRLFDASEALFVLDGYCYIYCNSFIRAQYYTITFLFSFWTLYIL